jgi:hypothetical protein
MLVITSKAQEPASSMVIGVSLSKGTRKAGEDSWIVALLARNQKKRLHLNERRLKKIPLFCPCSLSGTRARRSTAVLRVGGVTLRTVRRRGIEVEEAVAIVDVPSPRPLRANSIDRPGEQREETAGFCCSGEGREERKLGRGNGAWKEKQ